jgi:DNA repair exonuclease SbcCD ATPase subunit
MCSENSLTRMKWSQVHSQDLILQLSNQFNKEWNKLEVLCTKGLEKTAFHKNSKESKEESKINIISRVKEYIQVCGSRINTVFTESMNALESLQYKEKTLKSELEEQRKQIKFWEKTNEQIESQLNEVDEEKLGLAEQVRQLTQTIRTLKDNEKKYDLIINAKDQELVQKDKDIDNLLRKLHEKDESYKMVESEKSLAEQLQKDTFVNLVQFQDKNKKEKQSAEKEITSLNQINQTLNISLQKEVDIKKNLMQELGDLRLKLQKREIMLKAAYSNPAVEDPNQTDSLPCSFLKDSQLPRLSIHKDLDVQSLLQSGKEALSTEPKNGSEEKGNCLTGRL